MEDKEPIAQENKKTKRPSKFGLWFKSAMKKLKESTLVTIKKIPKHGWAMFGYLLGFIFLGLMTFDVIIFGVLGSLCIIITGYFISSCYHKLRIAEEDEVDKIIGEIAKIKIAENGGRLPSGELSPIDEETEKAIRKHLRYFRAMFWLHFTFASLFVSVWIYAFIDPNNMFVVPY